MFDNFISLGSACPVAASMAKWGLRSWSGPFDWLTTSSFRWVLQCLEMDFRDFLKRENLVHIKDEPRGFMDRVNGFRYTHDPEYFEGGGVRKGIYEISKKNQ